MRIESNYRAISAHDPPTCDSTEMRDPPHPPNLTDASRVEHVRESRRKVTDTETRVRRERRSFIQHQNQPIIVAYSDSFGEKLLINYTRKRDKIFNII